MNNTANNNKYKTINITIKVIIYIILVLWALIVLFPFYWMIVTSFKTLGAYASETTPQIIAHNPTFDNYKDALGTNLSLSILNTTIFAIVTTALMLVVTILASFAFARLDFKGKNILFTIFLSMMMIPNELLIVANFITIKGVLHWDNTFKGLIAPSILSIFYIYLLRQNFMQVSDNIYYAAKVDGATDFKYLVEILIPLSKPTIVTIAVLKLIECWNSYVWPSLITDNDNVKVVSIVIEELKSSGGQIGNAPLAMAAVVYVSLPLIVLFLIFRKQIMSGVSRTGTKG